MNRFNNQCALVTGAAGGIGRAIVKRLQVEGAQVAVADQNNTELHGDVLLPGDLTDSAYCDGLCEQAFNAMGTT